MSPRVSTRFGSKQLGLNELRGNGPTVEGYIGSTTDGRVGVHDLGDALLPCAVGPGDQDRHVRTRHSTGELYGPFHRLRLEHGAAQVVFRGQGLSPPPPPALQTVAFASGFSQLEKILNCREEPIVIPRLAHVVRRTGLHELHS